MGLIRAAAGAIGGVLADQWLEYFYCDSIDNDRLLVKGKKQSNSRTSNTKGHDNIISNGSGIGVADGQCMLIVEQGRVVEVCAEPGQFTYNSSTEPSIFAGNLGSSIIDTFKSIGRRFAYGGDTGKDQRIYFVNTKEILDNKFGTATPIPFRVVDSRVGLDLDVSLRCNGTYSFRIADPITFYTNLCGNVTEEYTKDMIISQMKAEFVSALSPAVGRLSELELRPNQIPSHHEELEGFLNSELNEEWLGKRGISIVSLAMNAPTLNDEDQAMLKRAQQSAVYRDPGMAAGMMAAAQADAMVKAAENEGGAAVGFMGMNMAGGAGAGAYQAAMQQAAQQQQFQAQQAAQQQAAQAQAAAAAAAAQKAENDADSWVCSCGQVNKGKFCQACGQKKPEPKPAEDVWICSCGARNKGKFCIECGAKKPEVTPDGWVCSCGHVNKGKFCSECGAKKPAGVPQYKCDKCGWEPPKGTKPPKFCPECGDPFDDGDIQ